MVKFFFTLLIAVSLYGADGVDNNATDAGLVVVDDPLTQKIKSFLRPQTYMQNKDFIQAIFDPASDYYRNDRVDVVKVIATLKENGLLDLFFEKPQQFRIDFRTNGSPLFFVKLMSDTLSSMGYFKYTTVASQRDASEFIWSIVLTSEYATDPIILQQELQKRGCEIVDIERSDVREWNYLIDISHAKLNVKQLKTGKEIVLQKSLYEHWLDVSKIKQLRIESKRRNRWYPYISYYDSALHLLKVTKIDKVTKAIELEMPKTARYIRITDLYTLKNIKDELVLLPKGSR